MEAPARVRPPAVPGLGPLRRLGVGTLVAAVLAASVGALGNQPGELAEALRSLGAPGVLWGRLAVEEESPDGTWTPLNGVEVQVYLAVPSLLAELERIRRGARDSRQQHETAVARIQAVLAAHQRLVGMASLDPGGLPDPSIEQARRQATDPAGLFVYEDLPSGEWVLVATRVTPYRASAGRPESARRSASGREPRFLPKAGTPVKEAELWLSRVRVLPGARVHILLTDRARWLTGPLR